MQLRIAGALLVALALLASGCGGGGSDAAVCNGIKTIQADLSSLTEFNPNEATKQQAQTALETIGQEVDGTAASAKSAGVDEKAVSGMESSFAALSTSVNQLPGNATVASASEQITPKVSDFEVSLNALATAAQCS